MTLSTWAIISWLVMSALPSIAITRLATMKPPGHYQGKDEGSTVPYSRRQTQTLFEVQTRGGCVVLPHKALRVLSPSVVSVPESPYSYGARRPLVHIGR